MKSQMDMPGKIFQILWQLDSFQIGKEVKTLMDYFYNLKNLKLLLL